MKAMATSFCGLVPTPTRHLRELSTVVALARPVSAGWLYQWLYSQPDSYRHAMTTIEEIEGERWPDPEAGSTVLVSRCHALRRKPLPEFTVEDLRIMLGQQVGVSVLLPLAVDALVRNPLAEGEYYPGDLLSAVLRLPRAAWSDLGSERQRLAAVLAALVTSPDRVDDEVRNLISTFLQEPK
jgi:hypothetical protein